MNYYHNWDDNIHSHTLRGRVATTQRVQVHIKIYADSGAERVVRDKEVLVEMKSHELLS